LRFTHAAFGAPSLDWYVAGESQPLASSSALGTTTPFVVTAPGSYRFVAREAGAGAGAQPLLTTDPLKLRAGDSLALVAVTTAMTDAGDASSLEVRAIDDVGREKPPASGARLRVVRSLDTTGPLSVRVGPVSATLRRLEREGAHADFSIQDGDALPLALEGSDLRAVFSVPGAAPGGQLVGILTTRRLGAEEPPRPLLVLVDAKGRTRLINPNARVTVVQSSTHGGRDLFATLAEAEASSSGPRWVELADALRFGDSRELTLPPETYELREYATIAGSNVWPETAADGLRLARRAPPRIAELRSSAEYVVLLRAEEQPPLVLRPDFGEADAQRATLAVVNATGSSVRGVELERRDSEATLALWTPDTEGKPTPVTTGSYRLLVFADAERRELWRAFRYSPKAARRALLIVAGRPEPLAFETVTWNRPDDADKDGFLAGPFKDDAPLEPNYAPADLRQLRAERGAVEQDDCPREAGLGQGCPEPKLAVLELNAESGYQSVELSAEKCSPTLSRVGQSFERTVAGAGPLRAEVGEACTALANALRPGALAAQVPWTDSYLELACSTAAELLRSSSLTVQGTAATCELASGCETACGEAVNCLRICGAEDALTSTCAAPALEVLGGSAALTQTVEAALATLVRARARLDALPVAALDGRKSIARALVARTGCGLTSLVDVRKLGVAPVPGHLADGLMERASTAARTFDTLRATLKAFP
jgi:hypothetical protein